MSVSDILALIHRSQLGLPVWGSGELLFNLKLLSRVLRNKQRLRFRFQWPGESETMRRKGEGERPSKNENNSRRRLETHRQNDLRPLGKMWKLWTLYCSQNWEEKIIEKKLDWRMKLGALKRQFTLNTLSVVQQKRHGPKSEADVANGLLKLIPN